MSPETNKVLLKMVVNGGPVEAMVNPAHSLLKVLREDLKLTGTKKGCEQGDCGACTVLLEGKAVNACLVLALQAQGKSIETIEGLGAPERLHPLQESFIRNGAVQCGFCTSGMLLSAVALLRKNPHPTAEEIRRGISGNLCRCTGYAKIVKAIQDVSAPRE
ncbi:MAG TPA: (2Fe-2S)-binding protein [Thermodesulfobacteriota bacterium]|nr:(2Fe-2S)-binding protein [Thermodesulfobacteriota bacterium]